MLQYSVNGQLNAGNILRVLYLFIYLFLSRGSGSLEACDRYLHKAQFSTLAFTRVVMLEAFSRKLVLGSKGVYF